MKTNKFVWAAVRDGVVLSTVEGGAYAGVSSPKFRAELGDSRYSVERVEGPVRA